MAEVEPTSWLSAHEKYALIGLRCDTTGLSEIVSLAPDLIVVPRAAFRLPPHWQGWVGTIRAKEIEASSLYVIAKQRSETSSVLDNENQKLLSNIDRFYFGLQLARKLYLYDKSFTATGAWNEREGIDVRGFSSIERPGESTVQDRRPLTLTTLRTAAEISNRLAAIGADQTTSPWRLFRCFSVFKSASKTSDVLDRIHQFTRCIEGLIWPRQANTKKDFMCQTELFIGPTYRGLVGEIYDVRSDVEHLHEDRHLQTFSRTHRLKIAKLEAVIEWIARSCLQRIVLNPKITPHFFNKKNIGAFWSLDQRARKEIWGEPIDPWISIKGLNPKHITDEDLGGPDRRFL